MKVRYWILLFVFFLAGFLLVESPANWWFQRFAPTAVRAQRVDGNLLRGQISRLQFERWTLHQVQWNLFPKELLALRLGMSFAITDLLQNMLTGELRWRSQTAQLNQLNGTFVADFPPFSMTGIIISHQKGSRIGMHQVWMEYQQEPQQLFWQDGAITVDGLQMMLANEYWELGNWVFTRQGNELHILAAGGVVDVQAKVTGTAPLQLIRFQAPDRKGDFLAQLGVGIHPELVLTGKITLNPQNSEQMNQTLIPALNSLFSSYAAGTWDVSLKN